METEELNEIKQQLKSRSAMFQTLFLGRCSEVRLLPHFSGRFDI